MDLTLAAYLSAETDNGRGILRGIAEFARGHPKIHVIKFARSRPLDPAALRRLGVDGMIATLASGAEARAIRALGMPLVNVTGEHHVPGVPTVRTDDLQVGRWAARYFHTRGFRHLCYCDNTAYAGSRLRGQALRAAAQESGMSYRRLGFSSASLGRLPPRDTIARLRRWVTGLPRPAGIFVSSDVVCHFLMEACDEAGLHLPEDVALLSVAVDSMRLAFAPAEISSIELNTVQIGRLAGEILVDLVRRRTLRGGVTLVPPLKIVTRRSSDRFAVADELVARALDFIRDHAGNPITVADVLAAVQCSRRVLELRFRAATGRSPYEEIQRQHFTRAVQLMTDPNHRLGEIADASGFRNPRHLSLAFRTKLNTTPTRFRERLLAGDPPDTRGLWTY